MDLHKYSISGFIQWLFLRYLSSTKSPQNECVSSYIGKSSKEITDIHKHCRINEQLSLIEIRLSNGTLTCDMYKDVCIDARLFNDKGQLFEPVLFESNQLKN